MKNVYGTIHQPAIRTQFHYKEKLSPSARSDGSKSYKQDQISQVTEKEESDNSEENQYEQTYIDFSAE